MRKLVIGGTIAAFVICASGIPNKLKAAPAKYDSSTNFLGTDVNNYIGQELFLNVKPKEEHDYGYNGFYVVNKAIPENVYKPNTLYYTTYDSVAGRYFKVLEVVKHPSASPGDIFEGGICFLKLEEKNTKEITFFEYNSQFPYRFPFIMVGFYEKQKKLLKGSDIVFTDHVANTMLEKTDFETGKPITMVSGQSWNVFDVQILEGKHLPTMILKNAQGEKTTAPFGTKGYSLAEANNYRKKFGNDVFGKILQGNTILGMTKEMCKLAWGEPYSITGKIIATRKVEQWNYDTPKALMFVNDRLIEVKK